jgi:thioredoxin
MKKLIINAFLLLTILIGSFACNQKSNVSSLKYPEITKLMDLQGKDVQIIDVRTPLEFAEKHLHNAINIDYNGKSFDQDIAKLDKSKPVLVYCLSGGRSQESSKKFAEAGFKQIYLMEGGLLTWENNGGTEDMGDSPLPSTGITMADYNKAVTTTDKIVIVDFNATWCGPCKQLSPILDQLEKEYPAQLKVIKIDVDENKELANEFKISSIPLLKAYNKGNLVWDNLGLVSKDEIKAKLGL